MALTDSLFLVYFLPLLLAFHHLAGPRLRPWIVALGSLVFFAWGEPVFVFLLLLSLLPDYFLIRLSLRPGKRRKLYLLSFLVLNLGFFLYYKYAGFLLDNLKAWLPDYPEGSWEDLPLALPLGISFILFQKISFALDVYRKPEQGMPPLWQYLFFILYFPKILSGPIARFPDFRPALLTTPEPDADRLLGGFFRFSLGLAKKVLIANALAGTVDEVFAADPQSLSAGQAWLGLLGYTFQIYFDFSGYTDMAIGLSLMLGYPLPENFNNPYIARSITEFWRRWHISLSSWLRDYLFLPLAYAFSRRMKRAAYLGLRTDLWLYALASLITMSLCGFWHGAAWTFLIWGLFHGLLLVAERLFLLRLYKKSGPWLSLPLTFFFVAAGWAMFRSESPENGLQYLGALFSPADGSLRIGFDTEYLGILILAAVLSLSALFPGMQGWQDKALRPEGNRALHSLRSLTALILFTLSLATVTSTGFSPFIYFRF